MAKKVASKSVEISTAQNVLVSYELASVFQRFFAGFLDCVFVLILNLILSFLLPSFSDIQKLWASSILFFWLYHLVIIIFFSGRSLGMRITRIRIISLGSGNLEFSDYFLRWILRPVDITLSACAVGLFSMLSTEKRQRLGDMLAGTAVVKLQPVTHFSLRDIMAFHQGANPENIKYPAVKHMEEKNMLYLKNLLQNPAGYSAEIQMEALDKAAKKFTTLLQLESTPVDSRAFLNQLVSDYIVLTR